MTLYLSPHDEIETYTEGMKYRSQELVEKNDRSRPVLLLFESG